MNARQYRKAMADLERLHWHLNLTGGPDMWTADLLRPFRAAAGDNADAPDDEAECVILRMPRTPTPAA